MNIGEISPATDFSQFAGVDLLIGGSPCQGFSFAGKQLAFDDPRSALFFEYVRALSEISPKNFLLENVKMKKDYLDVITGLPDDIKWEDVTSVIRSRNSLQQILKSS